MDVAGRKAVAMIVSVLIDLVSLALIKAIFCSKISFQAKPFGNMAYMKIQQVSRDNSSAETDHLGKPLSPLVLRLQVHLLGFEPLSASRQCFTQPCGSFFRPILGVGCR